MVLARPPSILNVQTVFSGCRVLWPYILWGVNTRVLFPPIEFESTILRSATHQAWKGSCVLFTPLQLDSSVSWPCPTTQCLHSHFKDRKMAANRCTVVQWYMFDPKSDLKVEVKPPEQPTKIHLQFLNGEVFHILVCTVRSQLATWTLRTLSADGWGFKVERSEFAWQIPSFPIIQLDTSRFDELVVLLALFLLYHGSHHTTVSVAQSRCLAFVCTDSQYYQLGVMY